MKNKSPYHIHAATSFFLLTIAVALLSWIGYIYELGNIQNLISPEGLRWMLRNAVGQYVKTPALGIVMILFMGMGVVVYSGMIQAVWNAIKSRKARSLKERRAIIFSVFTLVTYILIVFSLTIAPWTILRNVTGTLKNSPFSQGIYYIISMGIGLAGTVFGFASGRFHSDKDVIHGMGSLFVQCYDYFIILFFIVQFFTSLSYTHLADWLGFGAKTLDLVFQICCYLPLVLSLLRCNKKPFASLKK